MAMRVLILGLRRALVEDFRRELDQGDVELLTGNGLRGLADDEPTLSPNAVLRARRPG